VSQVKRDGGRPLGLVLVAALFCLVVAVGAGLQGRLTFAGPLWTPGMPKPPTVKYTQQPQGHLSATAAPHVPPAQPGIILNWTAILIVLGVLAVGAIIALVWLWRRRHPRAEKSAELLGELSGDDYDSRTESEPDLPTLQRGLSVAGDILGADREPADAIVRAWIGLQEAAEDSGVRRRPAETPTEFTTRVFTSVHADRDAASALLAVYLRARFGSHPVTADDVATARSAVARLTATWSVGAPE
jgi:hypothetical protein